MTITTNIYRVCTGCGTQLNENLCCENACCIAYGRKVNLSSTVNIVASHEKLMEAASVLLPPLEVVLDCGFVSGPKPLLDDINRGFKLLREAFNSGKS